MISESAAVLLRILIGESDRYNGKPLYQHLVRYLRSNGFAGATVLRGIEGFGRDSIIHTSSILDLSSDLPIVIEVVDSEEKISALKEALDVKKMLGSALVTEENVKVITYGE